jgi:flagellar assembly factor FliW
MSISLFSKEGFYFFVFSIFCIKMNFIYWKEFTFSKGKYWFDDSLLDNEENSRNSNAIPSSFLYENTSNFVYPTILDNTEGISGFEDLIIPSDAKLLLDIGGGKYDISKYWMEKKYPCLTFLVVDPYNRSREHNMNVQKTIENSGGADVVTSLSVLNVIRNKKIRKGHICLVYYTLKVGGIAFFKVWAGRFPERGTGKEIYDPEKEIYQANVWADYFREEVVSVFGEENVIIDNNKNLIICIKKDSE